MEKSRIEENVLCEYSIKESIRKYKKATAGYGISYLLEHVYGEIYLKAIKEVLEPLGPQSGLRLLEFGCGAGMNLIHLVSLLRRNEFSIECLGDRLFATSDSRGKKRGNPVSFARRSGEGNFLRVQKRIPD